MTQIGSIEGQSAKIDPNTQIQMATYIADLLQELGILARRTEINEREPILSKAREQAKKIADRA